MRTTDDIAISLNHRHAGLPVPPLWRLRRAGTGSRPRALDGSPPVLLARDRRLGLRRRRALLSDYRDGCAAAAARREQRGRESRTVARLDLGRVAPHALLRLLLELLARAHIVLLVGARLRLLREAARRAGRRQRTLGLLRLVVFPGGGRDADVGVAQREHLSLPLQCLALCHHGGKAAAGWREKAGARAADRVGGADTPRAWQEAAAWATSRAQVGRK
eukprot:4369463-Prymnesium_polylepis.1